MPMQRLVIKLAMAVAAGGVLHSVSAATQVSARKEKAARVRITRGPEIERADPDFAIVSWTSNNPGGSPEHYGVVHYGTDPTKLDQTAKSPIRLNSAHSYTVFRVRLDGLKPATTYYYKVDAMEANGNSDGMPSPVRQFTTPR
jgi:phosphodiesterase/alkaline phosphatase D-like protein